MQAILAARIDRLTPEAKRLLQAAALIGKDVALPLLLAIADAPEHEVRAELTRLQAAELLYETRLFPDLEYTFKHALTHEVAYGGLLHDRQRSLHARITEAIERLAPERVTERAEQLAHHALRGELWEKAVAYLRQAGLRAMARAANREAIAYLEQALGTLRRLPEIRETTELAIDLHIDLRNALNPLAEWARMGKHLREAEMFARTLGNQHRLARITTFMSMEESSRPIAPAVPQTRRARGGWRPRAAISSRVGPVVPADRFTRLRVSRSSARRPLPSTVSSVPRRSPFPGRGITSGDP